MTNHPAVRPLQRPFRLASPPLYQILAGKRNITADTALRLGRYFGTSADFWMNLQSAYELDLARKQSGKAIQRIPRRSGRPREKRPVASRGGKSGRPPVVLAPLRPTPGTRFPDP
jgi:addiction module HigA family antidote